MSARMRRNQVAITPFWNRMPRFFLYPLTVPGLYVLFFLAFLNGALIDIGRSGGGGLLIIGLLSLVAGIFAIKYGYDILEHTANGHLSPPRLNRQTLLEGYGVPFKQIGVLIVLAALALGVFLLWEPLIYVYFTVVVALLPAMVMTLALERSAFAALNPSRLFGMAFRIGWPYFAVLGMVILLNGGAATVVRFFGDQVPVAALAFISGFAQNFFWFVIMHLMGYLIYQYHQRVDFQPEAVADQDDGWGGMLDPVQEDLDAGRYDAAADRLNGMIREHPDHAIELLQRRHQVLRLTDRQEKVIDNAGSLMSQLIDANRIREATQVYIDITELDPALRPGREADYEPLLHMLVQRGEYRRAVRMTNGFHKSFPDSSSIPPLYLEVARILSEFLDRPDKARQVADFLIKRFPEHPAADRARTMRDALTG